jgi:hypothetical protein
VEAVEEVHENVLIFQVDVLGDEVNVDVYGGNDMMCGSLTYVVHDMMRRYSVFQTLAHWKISETRLAYVRMLDGSGGRLVEQSSWEKERAG